MEYEGEYLYNKKYNGKGYDKDGNIIYELINGNGKVHEYNSQTLEFDSQNNNNDNINEKENEFKFEGEYLDGNRNGKGKEYDYDGNLIYERK